MEPNNNIEKQFRQKLNEREIKPSEAAWDRLDAMLTVAEKPKKNYKWLYIAASFLGFILIGTIFFSQTEEIIDAPKNDIVLEHPINIQKPNTKPLNPIQPEPSSTIQEGLTVTNQEAEQNKKGSLKNNQNFNSNPKKEIINKSQSLASQSKTPSQKTKINTIIITQAKANGRSNQKAEQEESQNQIAQEPKINNEVSGQNQKPTYVDVDELLASVEKTTKKETSISKQSKVKVDSGSLLSQVDGELELSFREKVINTVNKNYKTVKVALSNRNKE